MTEYQTRSDFQVIRVFGCCILAGSWSGSNVKSEAKKKLRKEIKKNCMLGIKWNWTTHSRNGTDTLPTSPERPFGCYTNGHVLLDEGLIFSGWPFLIRIY